jgi:MYXO-CTERM domain-containing protein
VCDGNYVSASDITQCVDQLNGVLTAKISASGTSSTSCTGSDCTTTTTTKTNCSASPGPASGSLMGFGLAGLMAVIAKRRRTRR